MNEATFRLNSKEFEAALKRSPETLRSGLVQAFNRAGVEFVAAMEGRFSESYSPPWVKSPTDKVVNRTGNLARSLGFVVRGDSSPSSLRLFTFIGDARTGNYALTQEYGATIQGSPWLTIPLQDNYTASGVVRWQSAAALRDRPDVETWVQKSAAGNLIIKARFADSEDVKSLWVLKQKVVVPARLGFTKTFQERRAANVALLQKAVSKVFSSIGNGTSK